MTRDEFLKLSPRERLMFSRAIIRCTPEEIDSLRKSLKESLEKLSELSKTEHESCFSENEEESQK